MKKMSLVTQTIEVTVDESKFTDEFMNQFRKDFYDFDSVDDHIRHLAQLYARGVVDEFTTFIEGYGKPQDMGISFYAVECQAEIE